MCHVLEATEGEGGNSEMALVAPGQHVSGLQRRRNGRCGGQIRWASSCLERALLLMEATALKHLLAEDGDEERRGEASRGGHGFKVNRKYARFITCFQSACQPPKLRYLLPLPSADEEAFQDLLSDLAVSPEFQKFSFQRSRGSQQLNAKRRSRERSGSRPYTMLFSLPRLQGDFMIETLYNT